MSAQGAQAWPRKVELSLEQAQDFWAYLVARSGDDRLPPDRQARASELADVMGQAMRQASTACGAPPDLVVAPRTLVNGAARALTCYASTLHAQAMRQKNPSVMAGKLEEVELVELLERQLKEALQADAKAVFLAAQQADAAARLRDLEAASALAAVSLDALGIRQGLSPKSIAEIEALRESTLAQLHRALSGDPS